MGIMLALLQADQALAKETIAIGGRLWLTRRLKSARICAEIADVRRSVRHRGGRATLAGAFAE